MKELIYPALVTILSAVITTVLLPELASWLKSKTQNMKFQSAVNDLNVTAASCVNYVEQTLVADFKKSGTWNKQTQNEALQTALAQMLQGLTLQTTKYLRNNDTDITELATRYIQSYIQSQKSNKE